MYGTNGRQLREELTMLLRQHRIQQRLGGPGSHTIPTTTTPEQREQLGEQIQRFRHAILAWCLHAVAAANPRAGLESTSSRGPAEELKFRLTRRRIVEARSRIRRRHGVQAPRQRRVAEALDLLPQLLALL